MKSFQVLTTCVLAGLIGAACNNGGQSMPSGTQCPADFNPLPTDQPPSQKTSLVVKPDGTVEIPVGIYTFDHSELYYVDNRLLPDHNYRLFITENKDSSGNPVAAENCVRNSRPGLDKAQINIAIKSFNGMTVKDSKVADSSAKTYGFSFIPGGGLQINYTPAPVTEKPSDPNQPDPSIDASSSFMWTHPDNTNMVDMRYTGTAKDQSGNPIGTWYLSITFVRSDLK